MSAKKTAALLVGMAWLASAAVGAAEPQQDGQAAAKEARMFLLRYVGLTTTSDVAALDMYRDDARIRVSSWQGGREAQAGLAIGKGWKQQLRAGWFDGTTRMEASSFQDATVIAQGARLLIRAKRYSQTRCYWDNGYAVAIEPDKNGHYQIVEERLTFQRDAFCPKTATVATAAPPVPAARPAIAAAAYTPSTFPQTHSVARPIAQPSNVVPSGQGLPRLPAPMGATPGRAGAPSPSPAALPGAAGQ
jgi:hypothetical protein